jgi:phosphoglucosamine mutase
MGKLFGTDGIRGIANEYPMTPEIAVRIGKAVASILNKEKTASSFVIGKDTRISGDMLEYALSSGICSMGANVLLAGILPTPAIAFLTRRLNADAGIAISASHNPFFDNGIKLFDKNGCKLTVEIENEIEELILNNSMLSENRIKDNIGAVSVLDNPLKSYSDFLKSSVPDGFTLKGLKMVVDCSNGATYKIVPELLYDLGAENITILYNSPDGKNINQNCGSEHTESLINKVLECKSDIGIAFDGDGDRLIAVDEKGGIISGDKILAISSVILKKNGELVNNHVVSTVMSNLGLILFFKKNGINHTMSQVGDRYVMQEMNKTGSVLGGEDSGHIIFSKFQTTGDGILTALKLIQFMKEESKPLSELGKVMTVYPQVLLNIPVSSKPDFDNIPGFSDAVKHVKNILGKKGRVLVRYSGTQSVCRIMVEGESYDEIEELAGFLGNIVREHIG